MKRSPWASGSGYVPSDSIGFWVASTRKGAGMPYVLVPMGRRERIRPLGLDRVLGGQHEEGRGHAVRAGADGDLVLLHHLQQRALHLGRGAADLVGPQGATERR